MFEKAFSLFEEADIITVYRHARPDGDAYGSQWGLVLWLREIYPDKQIYALGKNDGSLADLFPVPDVVSDEMIKESLAVIVDTATKDRADDLRCFSAKKILKMDHHDQGESYGDEEYVFAQCSSCCEIITSLIEEKQSVSSLSKEIAKILLTGILTDTQHFTTTNSNASSLYTAAKLAETGISLSDLNYDINKISKNRFTLAAEFRSGMIFTDNHIGYGYVTKEMMERHNVSYNNAKGLVNEFNLIEDLLVWVLFIEEDQCNEVRFSPSIRSRGPVINITAAHFGGGGHKQAAGVPPMSENQIPELLKKLDEVVSEYIQNK